MKAFPEKQPGFMLDTLIAARDTFASNDALTITLHVCQTTKQPKAALCKSFFTLISN